MSNSCIQPFFRNYTSLNTGNDGEKGYKDITVNYTFYDQDYLITPDSVSLVRTADSLYPYDKISINDTSFVKDGAYGNLTPYVSDKIYKAVGLNDASTNQQYLVTWLSAGTPGSYGVWMDRYFLSDIVTRAEALSTSSYGLSSDGVFAPSFNTELQKSIYTSLSDYEYVKYNKVFDKVSDLVIEPSSVYYYDRVGPDTINRFVSTFDSLLINQNFADYYNTSNRLITQDLVSSTVFSNDKYYTYPVDNINKSGSFVLKFDIINNWESNSFHQLFGSKLADGFNITNDERITPFTFVYADKDLKVYNSDLTLIYSLSFDNNIRDVIVGNHLDDYHIVAANSIYKVNSFGHIKGQAVFNSLSSYINYALNDSGNTATFLLNASGSCYQINLDNFSGTPVSVNYWSLSTSPIRGIHYVNDTPYLFKGEKVRSFNDRYLFHLFGNRDVYREDLVTREIPTSVFCSTSSKIYDFNINNDEQIVLLHEDRKVTILDKTRSIIDSKTLPLSSSPYLIDFISEYTNYDYSFGPVVLFTNPATNTGQLAILSNEYATISSVNTGLSCSFIDTLTADLSATPRIKNLSFYNYFQGKETDKFLKFNLTLKNYYNLADTLRSTIKVPISSLKNDIQTFIVRLDEESGSFEVYKDNILFDKSTFTPYKYKFNLPITNHFIFGATGFYNNQTLADYLGQPGYYFVSNVTIENFKLYYDSLKMFELYPLMLENKSIDNLCLTLPCDQRNNIEEITRVFALTQPWNISNSVNIVVKNSNVLDTTQQQVIANSIILNANNTLPADVNINSIRFE